MRKCKRCGLEQEKELFANAGKRNGIQYYRHVCISCYSDIKGERKKDMKAFVDEYKKDKMCEICGLADFRVLEFHHARGKKEFCIGNVKKLGYGPKKIMEEIEKCDILCGNCHKILHYEERRQKYNRVV